MFLKKSKRLNGRIPLSIIKAYRNPLTGKNAHKQVSYLGYLDEYDEVYSDPISHFTELAKKIFCLIYTKIYECIMEAIQPTFFTM